MRARRDCATRVRRSGPKIARRDAKPGAEGRRHMRVGREACGAGDGAEIVGGFANLVSLKAAYARGDTPGTFIRSRVGSLIQSLKIGPGA